MTFKIINGKDYDFFNLIMREAEDNYRNIPKPLSWVEPSINMPYLEVVCSFVLGQNISSILYLGVLLEHILRMAVIDPINSGASKRIHRRKINKFRTI